MESTLIYWTGTPLGLLDILLLLPDATSTEFKRSTLYRPDSIELFGDKDVSHYRMSGSIEPLFDDTLPYPWTDQGPFIPTTSWGGGTYYGIQHTHKGGTKKAYSVEWQYYMNIYTSELIYGLNSQKWELELREDQGKKSVWFAGYVSIFDPEAYPMSGYPIQPDPEDESLWGKTYEVLAAELVGDQWVDHYGMSFKTVNYEQLNPVPYYWRSYMDQIRPSINPAALSEVIRNTITDATTWNTNNYANLVEIVDTIIDFRNGKLIDLIEDSKETYKLIRDSVGTYSGKNLRTLAKKSTKGVASAWLKYRYAYNTTKSDIESYARAKIGEYFGALDPSRVLRGSIGINGGTIRIKMRLHDKTTPNFEQFAIALNQYGLMPSLYNVWDMIPFSFVADWFTNLGDMLQDIDQRIYFQYYQIDELLVTYKQELTRDESWGETHYLWYERNFLDEWPQWEIYQDESKTSLKTKVFRGLDSLSLAIGSL